MRCTRRRTTGRGVKRIDAANSLFIAPGTRPRHPCASRRRPWPRPTRRWAACARARAGTLHRGAGLEARSRWPRAQRGDGHPGAAGLFGERLAQREHIGLRRVIHRHERARLERCRRGDVEDSPVTSAEHARQVGARQAGERADVERDAACRACRDRPRRTARSRPPRRCSPARRPRERHRDDAGTAPGSARSTGSTRAPSELGGGIGEPIGRTGHEHEIVVTREATRDLEADTTGQRP